MKNRTNLCKEQFKFLVWLWNDKATQWVLEWWVNELRDILNARNYTENNKNLLNSWRKKYENEYLKSMNYE